jgi:type I restriction enzyme M protein
MRGESIEKRSKDSIPQREKFFNNKEKVLGQFFTPYNLARFIVDFALRHVENVKRAIDPACGDGVFLQALLERGVEEVWGVDIDPEIIKFIPQKIREKTKIIVGDSLIRFSLDNNSLPENYFDIAVGNPPFSSKYGRVTDYRLKMYEISKDRTSEAIENLFIERFIKLVRPGGVIGIIVPDGVLLNKGNEHVRRYILKYKVLTIISLPRGIFRSVIGTTSKASVLFIKKEPNSGEEAFFYEASDENLDAIFDLYEKRRGCWNTPTADRLHPKHCIKTDLLSISSKFPVKMLDEVILEMKSGRTEYGEKRYFVKHGIRYISAKVVTPYGLDFSRDERYIEPGSPMDKKTAYVKPGDVLFVRVGVGCIGRAAAVIDQNDVGVADDWIYIIRVNETKVLPHYLAIYIQTDYARKQLEVMKRGVGTVTIPQSELKKLLIPIIPIELQEKIKNTYLEMIKANRSGDKLKAQQLFNTAKKLIEEILKDSF